MADTERHALFQLPMLWKRCRYLFHPVFTPFCQHARMVLRP